MTLISKILMRRKYLIYPKFQLTLMIMNSLVMIFVYVTTYLGVKIGYNQLHDEGKINHISQDSSYYSFIDSQSQLMYEHLFICFIVGLVISNLGLLFTSHKVVGPIYRLMKILNEIEQSGTIKPVAFRKDDFFQELTEVVNRTLNKIQQTSKEDSEKNK